MLWKDYKGKVLGFKFETKAEFKCPIATSDIEVNLRNRGKAIKTAMYGPLNPAEQNNEYWQKIADEWTVSTSEAKKQLCGNCTMFNISPEMKSCIKDGINPDNESEWDAVDAAGELGYCEAFDFKCAAKRTCRAWVTGGPVTSTQKKED